MKHLTDSYYSAAELSSFLSVEAQEATAYINSFIHDYLHVPTSSEHFSDVMMFDSFEYEPHPKGAKRKATRGRRGIYVFTVKEAFHLTKDEVYRYCNECRGALIDKKGELDLAEGQHFYQGSVIRQSFQQRMKDHYSSGSQVSSLQLNHPSRIIIKDKLRLFIFPVIKELEEHPFFIRMIEKELHNNFRPVAGSTRT